MIGAAVLLMLGVVAIAVVEAKIAADERRAEEERAKRRRDEPRSASRVGLSRVAGPFRSLRPRA